MGGAGLAAQRPAARRTAPRRGDAGGRGRGRLAPGGGGGVEAEHRGRGAGGGWGVLTMGVLLIGDLVKNRWVPLV